MVRQFPNKLAAIQQGDRTHFRRIVLPLDGSPVAERAIPYAETLAQLTGAPLHLVRVIDPMHPGSALGSMLAVDALSLEVWLEGERSAAREYLERLQSDLQARQHQVTVDCVEGSTVNSVLATIQPGDLLVMATHGRGGPARWFMGSTAEGVLRHTTVPVFLVRADESVPSRLTLRRIVVPLDGSEAAEQALPMARNLANLMHVPVHLVTVMDVSGIVALDLAVVAISADRLAEDLIVLSTEAEDRLAHACEQLGETGITATTDVLHGNPGLAITNATEPGDLIVMTTHGRTGPARWLLGSVAETVVRRSTVPVLLMRVEAEPSSR